jgi:hypothetical protein
LFVPIVEKVVLVNRRGSQGAEWRELETVNVDPVWESVHELCEAWQTRLFMI